MSTFLQYLALRLNLTANLPDGNSCKIHWTTEPAIDDVLGVLVRADDEQGVESVKMAMAADDECVE